ncbi:hypothetical protein FA10DRAFT_262899 [Acaromyces ingoldii]|uniref:Protection of telomeres protein 1 n=1 Tax=Acaromyces ingoldii TaxID=215250 RepID=A0A316YD46_9BASI|nr:hypothetical protein FA10DRAFT_262899 [Acaromyces ingoldii]PWN87149.1 hypothetical protein FA10DRAFT_262899 [Acaromyces ingoldii]
MSDEDEMKLGKLAMTTQWCERIRQGRGSNACLHVRRLVRASVGFLASKEAFLDCVAHPMDSHLPFTVRFVDGAPTTAPGLVETLEGLLEGEKAMLLSGFGARIVGDTDRATIVYDQGNLTLKLIDAAYASAPYLDACAGHVERRPRKGKGKEKTAMGPPPVPVRESATRAYSQGSSSSSSNGSMSPSSTVSATPEWMRTPMPPTGESSSSSSSRRSRPTWDRSPTAAHTLVYAGPRLLGGKLYTPISELDDRAINKNICVMGVVRTDRVARRALGGSRDWSLSVALCDVDDREGTHSVSFNLFSATEEDLPKCRPGQILCLRSAIKLNRFQSTVQGTGFKGFQWALVDVNKNVQTAPRGSLTAEESDELVRLARIYARDQAAGAAGVAGAALGSLATTSTNAMMTSRPGRQLIRLEEVEPNIFFDAIVEVVKVWDAAGPRSPPTIYVTDYTAHPLYLYRNDVHLGVVSRDECVTIEKDIHGDDGRGRVLQVALWDEQMAVAGLVGVGQIVRMKNVRPKRQAENGFLCAGIGGSRGRGSERSLCVVEVVDEGCRKEIEERKRRYLEEIAKVKEVIAKKQEEEQRAKSGKRGRSSSSSSSTSSVSTRFSSPEAFDFDEDEFVKEIARASQEKKAIVKVPISSPARPTPPSPTIPPPGQQRVLQPLTANESPEDAAPQDDVEEEDYEKEQASQEVEPCPTREARLAPTTLLDDVSTLPLRPLSDLRRLKLRPGQAKLFHCRVRIIETRPSVQSPPPRPVSSEGNGDVEQRLLAWVQVKCGICQKRLEVHFGFCPSCAEEDAKDVEYSYVFALLVGDASSNHAEAEAAGQGPIVLLASGKDANRISLTGAQ